MDRFIQKILTKRTLYLLCFMVLNYIEYLRATKPGNIWAAAANCTGLVMMVIVFSVLPLKEFFCCKYYIYTGICAAAMLAVYVFWRGHIGEFYLGQTETAVLNIWWIGLSASYLWKQVFVEKKIKVRIGVKSGLWIAFTIWTVISVSDKWWPVWFLFMFGIFYLVRFSEEDKAALMDGMINGTILSFLIMQGWAYLFRPYDEVRYKGAYSNCNMMALYYLIVYCMILFKLHLLYAKNAKSGWKVFCLAGAGGLLGFIFMTMCRTAWTAAVVVTFFYGILVFRRGMEEKWGKILLRGCALILCTAMMFPIVFLSVRWIPTIHPHPVWHEGEWRESSVHSWDSPNSEKYVEWDEFWDQMLERYKNYLKVLNDHDPFALRACAKENEIEIFTEEYQWAQDSISVRKLFYKIYLENCTWFGNSGKKIFVFPVIGIRIWHAQNLWLQMTYDFGYPAGILSLALSVAIIASAYCAAKKVKKNIYGIFPFLLTVIFFVYGLMEIVWNPGQMVLALFCLIQHPQITGV